MSTETGTQLGLCRIADPFLQGWICGILEGEGWFCKGEVGVEMTDKDSLDRLCALLGVGQVKERNRTDRKDHHKQVYVWKIYGKNARLLMLDVFPYMSARRQQKIQELIIDG